MKKREFVKVLFLCVCPVQVLRETFLFWIFFTSRHVTSDMYWPTVCCALYVLDSWLFPYFSLVPKLSGKPSLQQLLQQNPVSVVSLCWWVTLFQTTFSFPNAPTRTLQWTLDCHSFASLYICLKSFQISSLIPAPSLYFMWSPLLLLYVSFYFLFSFGTCTGFFVSSSTASSIVLSLFSCGAFGVLYSMVVVEILTMVNPMHV